MDVIGFNLINFMVFGVIFGVLLMAAVVFVYLMAISFVMWMAVDAAKADKFWWIVLILGLPLIGAVIYFFVEKKHEYMKTKPVSGHSEKKSE